MKRNSFAVRICKGQNIEFRRKLGEIWNDFSVLLDKKEIKNFSLWNVEDIVFGFYETQENMQLSGEEEIALEEIKNSMNGIVEWISEYRKPMKIMFENIGEVRPCKDLIKKRVFVTHLYDGAEDEYKRRHDAISAKWNGVRGKSAMSNFTIWTAGGYIFGYNEFDMTMKKEPTPEGKQHSIEWETKMLELMEWITDDVDWITGQKHSKIECIAQHN